MFLKPFRYTMMYFLALAVLLIALIIVLGFTMPEHEKEKNDLQKYNEFKRDTELIKGKVIDAKKENHLIFPDKYNLVVKIKNDNSKMVNVSEQKYRSYQKGSNVHFRIDKNHNNKIIRDLKNENDIDSLKEYKKYNKYNLKHLLS